jgi:RNA polymerase sigma factor (sigma-70 family)
MLFSSHAAAQLQLEGRSESYISLICQRQEKPTLQFALSHLIANSRCGTIRTVSSRTPLRPILGLHSVHEPQSNDLVGQPDEFQVRKMLTAITRGDRSALSNLYMSYYACLADFVSQFVEVDDRIEEVIIDTFMTIWETAREIPFEAKISVWFFRIARRHALKFVRRRAPRASAQRDQEFRRPGEPSTQRQTLATLSEALQCLPAEQRVVLMLCYKMRFSVREIAFISESQEEIIKLTMSQASRQLRRCLMASRP